jgi:hypothetical protein
MPVVQVSRRTFVAAPRHGVCLGLLVERGGAQVGMSRRPSHKELNAKLTAAIIGVFSELRPEHYANAGRPDKCTEAGFESLDMWPFVDASATLGCEVYVKLVLVGETIAMTLGLVSFHD